VEVVAAVMLVFVHRNSFGARKKQRKKTAVEEERKGRRETLAAEACEVYRGNRATEQAVRNQAVPRSE
jgi:hypothetical protein